MSKQEKWVNLSEFEEFGDFPQKQSLDTQKRQEDFLPTTLHFYLKTYPKAFASLETI